MSFLIRYLYGYLLVSYTCMCTCSIVLIFSKVQTYFWYRLSNAIYTCILVPTHTYVYYNTRTCIGIRILAKSLLLTIDEPLFLISQRFICTYTRNWYWYCYPTRTHTRINVYIYYSYLPNAVTACARKKAATGRGRRGTAVGRDASPSLFYANEDMRAAVADDVIWRGRKGGPAAGPCRPDPW